jgi:plastocyanin
VTATGTATVTTTGTAVTTASPTVTSTGTGTATATVVPTATVTGTWTAGGMTYYGDVLTARNFAFDKTSFTVPAGATVILTFINDDAGVPHNFALYTSSAATTPLFQGGIVTGQVTTVYTFTAPSQPGTYFFRCDVHPTTMTGSFVVT